MTFLLMLPPLISHSLSEQMQCSVFPVCHLRYLNMSQVSRLGNKLPKLPLLFLSPIILVNPVSLLNFTKRVDLFHFCLSLHIFIPCLSFVYLLYLNSTQFFLFKCSESCPVL